MPPKKKVKAATGDAPAPTRKSTRNKAAPAEASTSGAKAKKESKNASESGGGKKRKKPEESEGEEEDEDREIEEVLIAKAPTKKKAAAPKKAAASSSKSKTIEITTSSDKEEAPAPVPKAKKPTPKTSKTKAATKAQPAPEEDEPTSAAPSAPSTVAKSDAKGAKGKAKGKSSAKVHDDGGSGGKKKTGKELKKEPSFSENELKKLFEEYEDPDTPGTIGPEGYERLCTDAGLGMDTIYPLALAYFCRSSKMAHLTSLELLTALSPLRISSPSALAIHLRTLTSTHLGTGDPQDGEFKKFYAFLLGLCKEEGQKCVEWTTAVAVWGLLWPEEAGEGDAGGEGETEEGGQRRKRAVKVGRDFVKWTVSGEKKSAPKGVGNDVWNQLLEFIESCSINDEAGGALKGYSEEDSWPLVFDHYAEWVKNGRPIAAAAEE